jgi:hypothetical protein
MSYFEDLTPHTYTDGTDEEFPVLNVGWLGSEAPFALGGTSPRFKQALEQLCTKPIVLHRGYHPCDFCQQCPDGTFRLGNGQIRVQAQDGVWYSAPWLIHHYVKEHRYCPPQVFQDAVVNPRAVAEETTFNHMKLERRFKKQAELKQAGKMAGVEWDEVLQDIVALKDKIAWAIRIQKATE